MKQNRFTRYMIIALAALSLSGCGGVAANSTGTTKKFETNPRPVTQALTTVDHSTTLAETDPPETDPPEEEETKGEFELTTAKPKFDDSTAIEDGVICLTGSCEKNSVLTVSGSTFETYTVNAQEKRWFISIRLKEDQTDTITIVAQTKGKNASKKLQIKVAYDTGSAAVFVGKNSQLHYPDTKPDYIGNNLWSDKQKEQVKKNILRRLERAQEATGKDTKLIYLIAPNHLTIYPEDAPDDLVKQKKSDNSRLRQFYEIVKEMNNDEVYAVELIDYMMDNKKEGYLYFQTDTHWNTLGSYFGYHQLMDIIYNDSGIKGTKPFELDEMDVYNDIRGGGDLVSFLGFDGGEVSETTAYCNYAGARKATSEGSGDGEVRYTTGNTALPTCVVMRDSFGAALMDHTSEHFNWIVWTPWNCGLDACIDTLKTNKADYFLQVLVERSIGTLLS